MYFREKTERFIGKETKRQKDTQARRRRDS